MIAFIAAAIVIGATILILYLANRAFGQDSLLNRWSLSAFVFTAICLGGLMQIWAEEEAKGPCVRYETQMYWNAGAKTMLPARVCVERAEWVTP